MTKASTNTRKLAPQFDVEPLLAKVWKRSDDFVTWALSDCVLPTIRKKPEIYILQNQSPWMVYLLSL